MEHWPLLLCGSPQRASSRPWWHSTMQADRSRPRMQKDETLVPSCARRCLCECAGSPLCYTTGSKMACPWYSFFLYPTYPIQMSNEVSIPKREERLLLWVLWVLSGQGGGEGVVRVCNRLSWRDAACFLPVLNRSFANFWRSYHLPKFPICLAWWHWAMRHPPLVLLMLFLRRER